MQGILKITEETTEGTKQTNVSIGQLTKLRRGAAQLGRRLQGMTTAQATATGRTGAVLCMRYLVRS